MSRPTTSRLDKHMIAFGKGSRNCIGIHLAYAQLYMTVAAVVQRYFLEIWETDDSDVTPQQGICSLRASSQAVTESGLESIRGQRDGNDGDICRFLTRAVLRRSPVTGS